MKIKRTLHSISNHLLNITTYAIRNTQYVFYNPKLCK